MAATDDFIDRLDDQVRGIVDACTACGACVRACPTPDILGIDAGDGAAVAAGVLDILKTGEGPVDAEEWAGACCGSGHCLTVCEHGINPRFMLTMARRAMTAARPAAERERAEANDDFYYFDDVGWILVVNLLIAMIWVRF